MGSSIQTVSTTALPFNLVNTEQFIFKQEGGVLQY